MGQAVGLQRLFGADEKSLQVLNRLYTRVLQFDPPDDVAWVSARRVRANLPDDSRVVSVDDRHVGELADLLAF